MECPTTLSTTPAPSRALRGSRGAGGAAVLLRADAAHALERRAERERAAVADLLGDRSDRRARLAQQVGRERDAPAGEERHRRLADELVEAPGERRARHPG